MEQWEINAIEQARIAYPEHANCGHCGKVNNLADDCGWYLYWPKQDREYAVCKDCWKRLGLTTAER